MGDDVMTGTRAKPWLPQPDEATRDYVARYVPNSDPGFWATLRDACEAMPRTARVLAICAGAVVLVPVVGLIGRALG